MKNKNKIKKKHKNTKNKTSDIDYNNNSEKNEIFFEEEFKSKLYQIHNESN